MPIESDASRRHLSARQAETVDRLAQAAVDELASHGYDQLSVRSVAKRAGVAPATAYNYFSSKEHLMAVVFRHNLNTTGAGSAATTGPETAPLSEPTPTPTPTVERALSQIAEMAANNPALAAGYSVAMLSNDHDVARIRVEIGRTMHDRLAEALDADPRFRSSTDDVLSTLLLILTGGLVQAGMGHLAYDELPGVFERAVAQILGSKSDETAAVHSELGLVDPRPPERRPT